MIIYTITTIFKKPSESARVDWTTFHKRVVGFYRNLELAKECVENNWGALSECYFNYLVIEHVHEGIYNCNECHECKRENGVDKQNQWWYLYNDESNKWVECKKPFNENIINFGIG